MTGNTKGSSWKRRVFWVIIGGIALTSTLFSLAFYNHNRGPRLETEDDFGAALNRAIESSQEWFKANAEAMDADPNPAVLHMVKAMSGLQENPALTRVLNDYRLAHSDQFWLRIIDPNASTPPLTASERAALLPYQRWFAYAMDPGGSPISPAEKASLWNPNAYKGYELTHQLFAHYLYLFQFPQDEKTLRMVRHLSNRIAREADKDFKVTDLFVQRVAFLLMVGRTDLVRPRWVERIIENQLDDGGWRWSWKGWGPGWRMLGNPKAASHQHPTAQAAWALYQIQYRYPDWIKKHYGSSGA